MTQAAETEGIRSAATALYRFFAAFDGFDGDHTLGYEAEVPRGHRPPGGCPTVSGDAAGTAGTPRIAAVFTMEPTLTQVRRYVNGGGTVRGACTVWGRVRDDDAAQRQEAAAFFAALSEYVREHGAQYADGGRIFEIRPAAHPARLRLSGDGAVWELRCSVGIYN